ncbi:protein kinase [Bacillus sp. APMAM]|nr:protein kinase [Bacillus sp. APMAM]RTZ54398.1 protein kinase [Bacillus sp. SAJ1]
MNGIDLLDFIENWHSLCTKENFIGLGSTRKVYRFNEYVIKVHLNHIGYLQSLRELEIYQYIKQTKYAHIFSPVFYVDKEVCIQQYYQEVPMYDNQTFDIHERSGYWTFPIHYDECIEVLDNEWDVFDIKDSSNYGINEKQKLVLIDYGMSKTLYEKEWVPAAEKGEVPQIEVHICRGCGTQKEIRMYGKDDSDIRCIACGKE